MSVQETLQSYQITAEQAHHPTGCLHCGSTLLYRHDKKLQLFMDIPLHGKQTGILVARRCYLCRDCHRRFWEALPDMHPNHMMTERLVAYIEQAARLRTFASIAQEIGLDEKTIRLIFRQAASIALPLLTPIPLTWLGIDEIHLSKPYGVFSDIEHRRVVDLLPDRSKKTVLAALSHLPSKDAIELVTIVI